LSNARRKTTTNSEHKDELQQADQVFKGRMDVPIKIALP